MGNWWEWGLLDWVWWWNRWRCAWRTRVTSFARACVWRECLCLWKKMWRWCELLMSDYWLWVVFSLNFYFMVRIFTRRSSSFRSRSFRSVVVYGDVDVCCCVLLCVCCVSVYGWSVCVSVGVGVGDVCVGVGVCECCVWDVGWSIDFNVVLCCVCEFFCCLMIENGWWWIFLFVCCVGVDVLFVEGEGGWRSVVGVVGGDVGVRGGEYLGWLCCFFVFGVVC